MKKMTSSEACKFIIDNNIAPIYRNCGYTLEVILELDYGIELIGHSAWSCLENELTYQGE